MIYWWYLLAAIIFEVAGTTSMKLSEGFTKFWPSFFIFFFYAIAFIFLTMTLKKLDVGTAYAIWAGLGTLLIAIISYFAFHEPMGWVKIISIAFIILGVVGINLTTSHT